jgi:UDP-glucose 4-epimerase
MRGCTNARSVSTSTAAPVTSIAVAGGWGTVAERLLSRLASDEAVDRLIVVDRERPPAIPAGARFVRADLRDPVLARVFRNVDVVITTAFADHLRWDDDTLVAREHGLRRILDAVEAADVDVVVHLSWALVYGASERNLVPLSETAPLRADDRFEAVQHALQADEAVRAFAGDHPQRRVVVLRAVPAVVPDVDSAVTRHLESPLLPQVRGFDPPVQFVGVDDVVEAAVLVALDRRARGVYNVAADGWLTSSDVRHILARPALRLPEQIAVAGATALHRLGVLAVPPQALRYLMHPWVVDTSRLRALGWTPRTSQRDVLHQFVTEHRRWISFGRVRVRTMRLLASVAFTWTTVGAATLWLAWRRLQARLHAV